MSNKNKAIEDLAELIAKDLSRQCELVIKGRVRKWATDTKRILSEEATDE